MRERPASSTTSAQPATTHTHRIGGRADAERQKTCANSSRGSTADRQSSP